jgi:catechol 2,3-dioxygenase-like lactoylglutathione lyase family enzyme
MYQKNIVGIDHIALQVPDLVEGLRFFHQLLGFKTKREICFENHHIVMLQAGRIEIEMWETEAVSLQNSAYAVHHIAVQVKNLDAVVNYMIQAGVDVLVDIYESTQGIREAIVCGPGNIHVQFVEQNIPLLIWRSIKGDFKEAQEI